MSFLEVPSRIRDSMAIIREAISERFAAAYPNSNVSIPEFVPPMPFGALRRHFETYRTNIISLYALAFPPENFGKWSALQPNESNNVLNDENLKNTIAADLRSADIDPKAFFWEYPYRFGNGDFVRACYHLLNNKLLYFAPSGFPLERASYQINYSDYENNKYTESTNEIGDPPILVARGGITDYRRRYMMYHTQCRFVADWDGIALRGNWKLRYRGVMGRVLRGSVDSSQDDIEEYSIDLGIKEISGNGVYSDYLSIDPGIDVDFYRSWGRGKWEYVYCRELPLLETVLLTKDNFPPLNYKYLDL